MQRLFKVFLDTEESHGMKIKEKEKTDNKITQRIKMASPFPQPAFS